MNRGATKPIIILATGMLAVAGVGGYVWFESRRPPVLEVFVFDTPGQPAIFIRTPDDQRILFGGGANADIVRRLTGIIPFYSRRIDTIIAPDTDAKNVTGLIEVINRYEVGKLYVPAVTLNSLGLATTTDPTYEVFQQLLKDKNIPVESLSAGDQLSFGGNSDKSVSVKVLFPATPESFKYTRASAPRITLRIQYGSTSIMIAGNSTTKTQKFIATSTPEHSDVLVVSFSTTPSNFSREFLGTTRPDYIIYSGTTKKKLQSEILAGVLLDHRFNIKEKGMVKVVSDGHRLTIL